MGDVLFHHKKLLDRWADIFILKLKKEGPLAANEWANKLLDEETQMKLVPIISEKRARKK